MSAEMSLVDLDAQWVAMDAWEEAKVKCWKRDLIGQGAFGSVYECRFDGKRMALKSMICDNDKEAQDRFATTSARASHCAAVPTTYDVPAENLGRQTKSRPTWLEDGSARVRECEWCG